VDYFACERLQQFVLVTERFAGIDEVGGGIVWREDDERAAFTNLVQIARHGGLCHRHVLASVNLIYGFERLR
jgi:hypothetical protein